MILDIAPYLGGGFVFLFLLVGIRIVRPTERMLVETLGKFSSVKQPGFSWIIPIIQSSLYVNTTEEMIDAEKQEIITKDRLNATVDAQVYFKVNKDDKDLKNSQYEVANYKRQIVAITKTTLRNIIGDMSYEDANCKRDEINQKVRLILEKEAEPWGLSIVRVEMKDIKPTEDVQKSMNELIKAENTKKAAGDLATATETKADGERRASIKVSEGIKKSLLLEAEGKAASIKQIAIAKAEQIKLINQSIQVNFKGSAVDYKKLETAEAALQNGTKYVIDSKSNIMNVMSETSGVIPVGKGK